MRVVGDDHNLHKGRSSQVIKKFSSGYLFKVTTVLPRLKGHGLVSDTRPFDVLKNQVVCQGHSQSVTRPPVFSLNYGVRVTY